MKKFFLPLGIIVLTLLQLSWPGPLYFFNCKPDLLLVFALSAVFFLDFKAALALAILAGLAKDLFLPSALTVNIISFSGWSFLVYRLSSQISMENEYVRLFIVLTVSFLNNLITGLIIVNSGNAVSLGIFSRNLIIPSVYSALLFPLVLKFVRNTVS